MNVRRTTGTQSHRWRSTAGALTEALAVVVVSLTIPGCAQNGAEPTPTPPAAEPTPAHSDPQVKVDQVGYLTDASKIALVTDPRGTGRFSIRRAADRVSVFDGQLGERRSDVDTGDWVQAADFSSLRETGTFLVDVEGVGASVAFEIGPDVYRRAFVLALRSFYGQRCGTAVDLAPAFPSYRHALCHGPGTASPDALFHSSSGRVGSIAAGRGWHDAGDYGKYVVNSGISTGELLWTYELYRAKVGPLGLNLPESGDQTPDILDEIRWNLDWMLTMQDSDGGVWHKLTSAYFGGFVMPEVDNAGPRYIIGTGAEPYKSSCATADFAAVMAIAARLYGAYDAAFAARCLSAARDAYAWVSARPNVVFRNCCGISTGEYGDSDCSDERLWAAAELFRTTGEAGFDNDFIQRYSGYTPAVRASGPPGWGSLSQMAMLTYALASQPSADAAARQRIREDAVAAAEAIVTRTNANLYRVSLGSDEYNWGSNGVVASYGMVLLLADRLAPKATYRAAALDNLHYLLGRNTFALSWVTQLGARPFRFPHHRPSGADANAEPWPGLLSGGPNRYGGDSVIDALPATPPARRYADDQGSYASNEVALNWNAPLVFLLAGVTQP